MSKPPSTPIKIVYAGLLGVAQGLSTILKNINIPEQVEFHIYGDGPDAETLISPDNLKLVYHGSLTREELHKELRLYDVAFIPLVQRIYGSVPSKVFEYARLGLPLLYMAGGEGSNLVQQHRLGWTIPACDYNALQQFLNNLSVTKIEKFQKKTIQKNAVEAFDFKLQFKAFKKEIERL